MAATAATAVAHQLPPMSIPAMPRIRPPRMLKGDPHPNNAPPPQLNSDGRPPHKYWVQGKWRPGVSKAVRNKRATQDIQVAKALRHQTHGLDIYAYRHIRTNQVVYSLSRTLQVNKVLKQLLYHGKKTVPATVRNDMWTPYFSIHFPPTPAGALEGLFAFQKLRELSMQRQLSPPEDLIRATQEDIDIVKSKLGSPTTLQEMAVQGELKGKIPKLNEILPKKLIAKKLMDQKATSVADAAFVLDWILSGPSPWERVTKVATSRAIAAGEMSARAAKRVSKIRKDIEEKAAEIRKRASLALEDLAVEDPTSLKLNLKTIRQLGMEHQIVLGMAARTVDGAPTPSAIDGANLEDYITSDKVKKTPGMDAHAREERSKAINTIKERQQAATTAEQEALKEFFQDNNDPATATGSVWEQVSLARENALDTFDTKQRVDKLSSRTSEIAANSDSAQTSPPSWATNPSARTIKMYWSDMNDGLFASSWPRSVIHGALAPFGVAKAWTWAPHLDEAGNVIQDAPLVKVARVVGRSVHVMGRGVDEEWVDEEMMEGGKRPDVWEEPPRQEDVEGQEEDVQVEYKALKGRERDAAVTTSNADVVVETRPKGVWARVKGLFGR